jgi:hypothetical protein
MILRITDTTGDTMIDTDTDMELAVEFFQKATNKGMWGKGIKGKVAEFLPTTTPFEKVLEYDEVVMLPQQVGG